MIFKTILTLVVLYWFWVGVWMVIFRSPLLPDLVERFVTKSPMTHNDVENWLISNCYFGWHRLWTCLLCQSFWVSLAVDASVAVAFTLLFHNRALLLWFPLGALVFYPFVILTLHKRWKL